MATPGDMRRHRGRLFDALFGEALELGRRRRRRQVLLLLVCCAAVAVVLLAMRGGGGQSPNVALSAGSGASAGHVGGLPPVPFLGSPGQQQAFVYVERATLTFLNHHRSCASVPQKGNRRPTVNVGSPPQLLLSTFGVFALPNRAAMPQNGTGLAAGDGVFVEDIRVAQTRFGWPFKVIPVTIGYTGPSTHCLTLEAVAVRASIAHAPANVRAMALQIAQEQQMDRQYVQGHHEGICVSGYHAASLCAPFLLVQARGAISFAPHTRPNPVVFYLVPNGVAKITARYYPDRSGNRVGSPTSSVTVPVVNNLAVWRMTNEPGDITPTIAWHAPNGRIIRTVLPG